jgi:hypothetical protein
VLRDLRELKIYTAVLAWWAVLATVAFWPLPAAARALAFVLLAGAPFAAMALRKRSLRRGTYSVVSWCFHAAGLVRGLLRARTAPAIPLPSRDLREPARRGPIPSSHAADTASG